MTTGMIQDSIPSATSQGPRFRPYASPNHQVTKGRYITSNDHRGYIPVYEYPLNNQWIMMDIDDGYILWTGIWKALGNSKADIVKMIDSQPDLAPLIRRVRGGYLKIQGTWMPYEVALRLSRRVAWPIRNDLVPLFGPTFPDTCLSPDQPGYGQVVATGTGRRRMRRNTQAAAAAAASASASVAIPREPATNWTVVTPAGTTQAHTQPDPPYHPVYQHALLGPPPPPPTSWASASTSTGSPVTRERTSHTRYSPYPPSASLIRKESSSSRSSLSLDIPALEQQQQHHIERSRLPNPEEIKLAPIHHHFRPASQSYALPPISALEDLRGVHSNDSAAVLRRLKSDDSAGQRLRSASRSPVRASSSSNSGGSSPQDGPSARELRAQASAPELSLSVASSRHGGTSTCDPSPVSPATPQSVDAPGRGRAPSSSAAFFPDKGRAGYAYPPVVRQVREWSSEYPRTPSSMLRGTDARLSACRHSCSDGEESDGDVVMRPVRPW